MHVFTTPTTQDDGNPRSTDDFAPRANIKRLFKAGAISSSDSEKLKEVSRHYYVDEKYVSKYVHHLEKLQTVTSIRKKGREKLRRDETNKPYDDYDWETLIQSGKLNKLKVPGGVLRGVSDGEVRMRPNFLTPKKVHYAKTRPPKSPTAQNVTPKSPFFLRIKK